MTSVIYYPGYSQITVTPNLRHHQIASITQANPMVLTTTDTHNYRAGVNVGFLIPVQFGMVQLNANNGNIISVTPTTMTIAIDSTNFTPFAYPSPLPSAYTPPSVYANAEGIAPKPPLPYGNERSFDGTIYNAGQP